MVQLYNAELQHFRDHEYQTVKIVRVKSKILGQNYKILESKFDNFKFWTDCETFKF